jgi:hypothetical protein
MTKPKTGGIPSKLQGIAGSTMEAPKRGRPDKPYVAGTILIPRPTNDRLNIMARDRKTSLQGLFMEALDMWLAAQGEPPFLPEGWATWKGPAGEEK